MNISATVNPNVVTVKGSSRHDISNNARSVSIFSSKDEKLIAQVEVLLKQYDSNNDGRLGAEEILEMHEHLRKTKTLKHNFIKASFILFVLLFIAAAANFGIQIWACLLTKDVTLQESALTKVHSSSIVATSSAHVNIPLALLPLAGISVLDKLIRVQFTALNVSLSDIAMGSAYVTYPTLVVGMEVASYQYFNETTVVLKGRNDEMVLVQQGLVSCWGLVNMSPDATAPVCPGLQDSSHAVCSLVTANDVDTQGLRARGTSLGFHSTYSSCR